MLTDHVLEVSTDHSPLNLVLLDDIDFQTHHTHVNKAKRMQSKDVGVKTLIGANLIGFRFSTGSGLKMVLVGAAGVASAGLDLRAARVSS